VRLVVEQGYRTGQSFPLEQSAVTIGRSAENDLVLREQGVSRRHARIQRGSQGWMLSDLGSTNGTYVNGRKLASAYVLRTGDRVTIGGAVLLFEEVDELIGPEAVEVGRETPASAARRPALMILGAVLVVVILVGIVLLLVNVLQSEPQPTPAAATADVKEMLGTISVPTQIQEVVPVLETMVPQDLLPFP
jgi:pSer/pThr/pTyr-binding forkhead associated (FHA) protein